jgi:hypothetical protein
VAGFKSERVAGFNLECMAGFVGIRTQADRTPELVQIIRSKARRRPTLLL